jgi:hypothetical protein
MYEKPVSPTHPGTEMKVTPEREAPIIPMDTMYQGDFRLPRKNVSLSDFLPVTREMIISSKKYPPITEAVRIGFMQFFLSKVIINRKNPKRV